MIHGVLRRLAGPKAGKLSQVDSRCRFRPLNFVVDPLNFSLYQGLAQRIPQDSIDRVFAATNQAIERGIVAKENAPACFHFYLRRCARAHHLEHLLP